MNNYNGITAYPLRKNRPPYKKLGWLGAWIAWVSYTKLIGWFQPSTVYLSTLPAWPPSLLCQYGQKARGQAGAKPSTVHRPTVYRKTTP